MSGCGQSRTMTSSTLVLLLGPGCCRALILQTTAALIVPMKHVGRCRHRDGLIGTMTEWGTGEVAGGPVGGPGVLPRRFRSSAPGGACGAGRLAIEQLSPSGDGGGGSSARSWCRSAGAGRVAWAQEVGIRGDDYVCTRSDVQHPALQHMAAVTRDYHYEREAFDRHWERVRANPEVLNRTIVLDEQAVGQIAVFGPPDEREVTPQCAIRQAMLGVGACHRAPRRDRPRCGLGDLLDLMARHRLLHERARIKWSHELRIRVVLVVVIVLLVRLGAFRGHRTTTNPWLAGLGLTLVTLGLGLAVGACRHLATTGSHR